MIEKYSIVFCLHGYRQKLSMPEFSHKECTKKFKELLTNKVWSLQLVNVFVARYLLQAKECSVTKGNFQLFCCVF